MTINYQQMARSASRMLVAFGTEVTYGSYSANTLPTLEESYDPNAPATQQIGEDDRIEKTYQVTVVFRTGYLRRQVGYAAPYDQMYALMGRQTFLPKPGDYLLSPKRYAIDDVTIVDPSGKLPILYVLELVE